MKLVTAVYRFFGKRADQSAAEFKQEYDVLTDKDKQDLAVMLSSEVGETVEVT